MHLSCHIHECIIDYGPLHSFWCFGFEHFNGVLGSYQNNNKDVAVTMLKKVHDGMQAELTACMVHADFQPILKEITEQVVASGSLRESLDTAIHFGSDSTQQPMLLKPFKEFILLPTLFKHLTLMYQLLHGDAIKAVSQICIRSYRLSF